MLTGTRGELKCYNYSERRKNNNTGILVCGVIQRSVDYSCNIFLLKHLI